MCTEVFCKPELFLDLGGGHFAGLFRKMTCGAVCRVTRQRVALSFTDFHRKTKEEKEKPIFTRVGVLIYGEATGPGGGGGGYGFARYVRDTPC